MKVTVIDLYDILKSKIGDKEAKTLVESVELKVEKKFEEQMNEIVTKSDVFQVKNDLEIKIEKIRADLIKWMFIFWVGQVSITIAMVLLFLK
jgi:hypothetical protein